MRCGKCKTEGVDINHVKSCYGIKPETGPFKDWGMSPKFTTDSGMEKVEEDEPFWPPSDAQVGYAMTLQEERVLPDNWETYTDATLRLKNKDEVSGIITMLKSFPRKDKGEHPEWTMPAGRYCVEVDTESKAELYFVQIDKPTEGRWKGYTFAKRLIGAPGDYAKVAMSVPMRNHVMRLIEADPKAAMVRYGVETATCGRCSSPLTDPVSRELGIGPKCRAMSGWF